MVHNCFLCGLSSNNTKNLPFFRFPKNDERRLAWANALGVSITTKWQYICGNHFSLDSYIFRNARKKLKPDAIPFVCENTDVDTQSHSTPKKKRFWSSNRFGDLSSSDLETSNRASKNFKLVKKTVHQLRNRNKNLYKVNKRLKAKVTTSTEMLADLKKKSLLLEFAVDNLKTRNFTETTSTSGAERLQLLLARGTGHKRLDDDLFAAVDVSLKAYRRQGIFEIEEQLVEPEKTNSISCCVNGCVMMFETTAAYDSHYNSNHRYTCVYCRKLLQSAHLLDIHLSETHDNFFLVSSAKKPMFKCLIETCDMRFWNGDDRNKHCIGVHKMSKNFLLHYANKKSQKKKNAATSPKGLENIQIEDLNLMDIDKD